MAPAVTMVEVAGGGVPPNIRVSMCLEVVEEREYILQGEVLTGSGAWSNIADRDHGGVGIDDRGGGHVTVGWTASGHRWNNGSLRDDNSGAVHSANNRGSGDAGLVG